MIIIIIRRGINIIEPNQRIISKEYICIICANVTFESSERLNLHLDRDHILSNRSKREYTSVSNIENAARDKLRQSYRLRPQKSLMILDSIITTLSHYGIELQEADMNDLDGNYNMNLARIKSSSFDYFSALKHFNQAI